jgi:multicomponent Na+:H+ antiporter subunit D
MSVLLPAAVLVPAVVGVVCLPLPRRLQVVVGLVGAALTSLIGLGVVAAVVAEGPLEHILAGWDPPLGIALRADGLSAAFVALTSVVALAIAFVAASEEAATGERAGFWVLSSLAWSGLNGVFLAGDLFNAYVALEILGLAAVGLVALGGRGAPAAALRYLVVAVLGSLLFLLMVALVYGATGTLDIAQAAELLPPERARLPLALATLGLALKCALAPMHAWLPPAHAGAPAAVSPLLSALVVKGAFYLVLRLWTDLFPIDAELALVAGLLGALGVVWGGLLALRQDHLKRIVAYSTVAQVGYLFLALPLLALPGQRDAMLAAAVTMALAHGLAKAAMFVAAGSLLLGTGTDHIDGLKGASRSQRMLTAGMMMATVSLIGLPLSLGFAAKWEYALVATETGSWWVLAVLVLGSLLAAAYLVRPVASLLRDADDTHKGPRVTPAARPAAQRHVPVILGLAAVVTGLLAAPLAQLVSIGAGS